jgi:hypothetical protein
VGVEDIRLRRDCDPLPRGSAALGAQQEVHAKVGARFSLPVVARRSVEQRYRRQLVANVGNHWIWSCTGIVLPRRVIRHSSRVLPRGRLAGLPPRVNPSSPSWAEHGDKAVKQIVSQFKRPHVFSVALSRAWLLSTIREPVVH